jgi:hypothetical protein
MGGELTISEKNDIVAAQSDRLLEKVLDSGNIEVLERFIALREKEEARQAKIAYDHHFAEMQKDYVPVQRKGEVKNNAKTETLYKFCPLEDILKVYAPVIAKHGFSFRWYEECVTDTMKRIFCVVSGYGHEEKGYVDIPIQAGTSFTNSIQQRGVSTSYGKRYSFINAFGVIIEDEDDDAVSLTFDDGVRYADLVLRIDSAETKEDLVAEWKAIWNTLGTDQEGKAKLTTVYNKKKDELMKAAK